MSREIPQEDDKRGARLARIRALAMRATGSAVAADAFMTTPHDGLGGIEPINMADSDEAAARVEALLNYAIGPV